MPEDNGTSVDERADDFDEPREDEEDASQRDRFIVLLRHGIAEDRSAGKSDEERSLTTDGHARMKQIGRGLEHIFPKAEAIFASPLLRTVQSALWVSKGYRSRMKVQTSDALVPSAGAAEFQAWLAGVQERRIIVVGHEPNLSAYASRVIGLRGGESHLELKRGACYGVRIRPDGVALLEWLLSPRLLRRFAV